MQSTHLLIDVDGSVALRRAGWNRDAATPALFGTELRAGDIVQPEAGAQVQVLCADMTVAPVTQVGGVPCPEQTATARYGGSEVHGLRGRNVPLKVVSPRGGKLLTNQPLLRWTALDDTSTYSVTVRQAGDVIWATEVTGSTELVYPADAPSLEPGAIYSLVVFAESDSTLDEQIADGPPRFSLLTEAEQQAIQAEEDNLRALVDKHDLDETALHLLRAELYQRHDLRSAALEQLDDLAHTTAEPAVWRRLGVLYANLGLPIQAQEALMQAQELSEDVGDTEGEALAAYHLARVVMQQGNTPENREQAREHFARAIAGYRALGAEAQAEEIAQERNDLIGATE
jgi:hypothetical protein